VAAIKYVTVVANAAGLPKVKLNIIDGAALAGANANES
jgi:hypothetical protein